MSTHNLCFCGEIRKISIFFMLENVPYRELCMPRRCLYLRSGSTVISHSLLHFYMILSHVSTFFPVSHNLFVHVFFNSTHFNMFYIQNADISLYISCFRRNELLCLFSIFFPYEIGPRHAKTCLQAYADSKGTYQPVHLHSLIRPSLSANRIIKYCRMYE